MAEYVSRESVLNLVLRYGSEDFSAFLFHEIKQIPAADVRPVVHGHWFISECEYLDCSICGTSHYTGCESTKEAQKYLDSGYAPSFCPGCGADMRGTGKEDKATESNSKKQCPVCGRKDCFICAYCGADMRKEAEEET